MCWHVNALLSLVCQGLFWMDVSTECPNLFSLICRMRQRNCQAEGNIYFNKKKMKLYLNNILLLIKYHIFDYLYMETTDKLSWTSIEICKAKISWITKFQERFLEPVMSWENFRKGFGKSVLSGFACFSPMNARETWPASTLHERCLS